MLGKRKMGNKELLPCPNCGADAFEGTDTTVTAEQDFEFGGEPAERDLPGKVCPECGHEFAL